MDQLDTHEVIGATQGITSAFLYGIFIITILKNLKIIKKNYVSSM